MCCGADSFHALKSKNKINSKMDWDLVQGSEDWGDVVLLSGAC